MGDYDKKIAAERRERDSIIKKKKELREGGTLSGTNTTRREELNKLLDELRKARGTRNEHSRKLKEFHDQMDKLDAEKS